MRYRLPDVTNEVGIMLREGGRRRDSFLLQIADSRKILQEFSKKYDLKCIRVELTTESSTSRRLREEPMYFFSNNLGGYIARGLRNSLQFS